MSKKCTATAACLILCIALLTVVYELQLRKKDWPNNEHQHDVLPGCGLQRI